MAQRTLTSAEWLEATVCTSPLSIYMGKLGQIGDIVMCSAVARRVKELFPTSSITFAVSEKYREAGELIAGLPYIDELFVTRLYFEKLTPELQYAWWTGSPVDLRGYDEVQEQERHNIVLTTRPRHGSAVWWERRHAVDEVAHMMGIPYAVDCRTEIRIPEGTAAPEEARGKIVLHNDPVTDDRKAWSWESLGELVKVVGPERCVLLGGPGPEIPDVLDLRGKTTLAEAAAIIRDCRCFVGVDSGLMWIAGSLEVPTVGLYGCEYVGRQESVQPVNPRAVYLEAPCTASITVPEVLSAMRMIQDS